MSGKSYVGSRYRQAGNDAAPGSIVRSVISWCEALNGTASLQDALAELIAGVGAEAAMIVRTNMHDLRPVRIAVCDMARDAQMARPLRHSFADSFFGPLMISARTATTWVASAHMDDCSGDPALSEWQTPRHLKEFVVFVLSAGGMNRDHLELHFRDRMSSDAEGKLMALLCDMAGVWARRKSELIGRTIDSPRGLTLHPQRSVARRHVLSTENPAQLSRAEFRVCLLLGRGLLVQAVGKELDLSEPTIRTHLRNIYAKTDCTCLAELVFRLMDGKPPSDQTEARYA